VLNTVRMACKRHTVHRFDPCAIFLDDSLKLIGGHRWTSKASPEATPSTKPDVTNPKAETECSPELTSSIQGKGSRKRK
jgi:hypothetical protein